MFDMGFTELVLIGIVALVVIGPERLPAVARTAGKYFGKLRRFMTDVKADVESELRADELREILSKQQDELQSLKNIVEDVGKDVDQSVNEIGQSVDDAVARIDDDKQAKLENVATAQLDETSKPAAVAAKPKATAKTRTKKAKPKSAKARSVKAKTKKAAAK